MLQLFEIIENRLIERKDIRVLTIEFQSDGLEIGTLTSVVKKHGVVVRQMSITELINHNTTELKINCRIDEEMSIRRLFEEIKTLGDIRTLRID